MQPVMTSPIGGHPGTLMTGRPVRMSWTPVAPVPLKPVPVQSG